MDPKLQHYYQFLLGALLYIARATHPDIAFASHRFSKFSHNPPPHHWSGLKRVLQYLKGTSSYGLRYAKSDSTTGLQGNSDASFMSTSTTTKEHIDTKSTLGFLTTYNGMVVNWRSKGSALTHTSSTESETDALTAVIKEILCCKSLLLSSHRFPKINSPVFVHTDNAQSLLHSTEIKNDWHE